jgi:hypothetical protein
VEIYGHNEPRSDLFKEDPQRWLRWPRGDPIREVDDVPSSPVWLQIMGNIDDICIGQDLRKASC